MRPVVPSFPLGNPCLKYVDYPIFVHTRSLQQLSDCVVNFRKGRSILIFKNPHNGSQQTIEFEGELEFSQLSLLSIMVSDGLWFEDLPEFPLVFPAFL